MRRTRRPVGSPATKPLQRSSLLQLTIHTRCHQRPVRDGNRPATLPSPAFRSASVPGNIHRPPPKRDPQPHSRPLTIFRAYIPTASTPRPLSERGDPVPRMSTDYPDILPSPGRDANEAPPLPRLPINRAYPTTTSDHSPYRFTGHTSQRISLPDAVTPRITPPPPTTRATHLLYIPIDRTYPMRLSVHNDQPSILDPRTHIDSQVH